MFLDAAAATALAATVLISTQGVDRLTPQLPLQVVDRGVDWLVKGTPYDDPVRQTRHNAFWIFIRKTTAEIVGIGFDGRMIPTEDVLAELRRVASPDELAQLFGPRLQWEAGGDDFAKNISMHLAIYGGLINTSDDAVAYARVLMRAEPKLAALPRSALSAEERDGVWHITMSGSRREVMTFSRRNGRLLAVEP